MGPRVAFLAACLPLAACVTAHEPPALAEAARPHPNSISAQMAGEWRHSPQPVGAEQFQRDKAACLAFSSLTPDGAGTPGLRGTVAFLNCLKAKGYVPIPPQGVN